MLINRWMPSWDVAASYESAVRAPPERVWRAMRTLDLARSPVIRALFALRSLPGLLTGRRNRERALGVTMEGLLKSGFVLLEERPGDEIVLGLVGQFWKPTGGIVRVTPEEFLAFDRPGYALATWNFTLRAGAGDGASGDAVRLRTETRVRCTSDASRRSFRRYWTLIGPFSGLTRVAMLRAVRRAAESPD
jgi:hypothetical protein